MSARDHISDPVELLRSMVRFPSLSGEEREIADFVERLVAEQGLEVGRHGDNVYFWLGDGLDCLLLNSHLDVVPPSSEHPHGAFEARLVDGKVYGRGTVDAKASGAAMTMALLELAREGWAPENGRLLVALTTCEETGGGYNGLEDLLPHLPHINAALVGEPTDMQPCFAQKGLLILRLTATGHTAHAARPHLGLNAIERAAEDILQLRDYRFPHEDPYLGRPTLTVTTIEGGTARNVVPDRCTYYVDVRTTPGYDHDTLADELSSLVASSVEIHSKRFVPVATPPDSRIARACRTALPLGEPFGSPTASDWIFLRETPTVKIGPGSSELSHSPDEHISAQHLYDATRDYKRIVEAYFSLRDDS